MNLDEKRAPGALIHSSQPVAERLLFKPAAAAPD
jgi:hypothetical protein